MDDSNALGAGYSHLQPFKDHESLERAENEGFARNIQNAEAAKSNKLRSMLLAVLMASLVFAIVVILATIQDYSKQDPPARQPGQPQQTCGASPSEAKDRQCVFDIVSRFWIPQDCFYPEIDREFRARMKSPYFGDINGTFLISREKLPDYTGKLFVRADYHRMHCAFLLRRNHLAVKTGGKLAARMTSFEHTEHCTDVLLEVVSDSGRIGSIFDLAFPACVDARDALRIGGEKEHHSSAAPELVPREIL